MSEGDRRESAVSRRRVLGGLGVGALAGLTGCLGGRDDEHADPTATTTDTGTPGRVWDEGGPPDRTGWDVTFHDRFDDDELDRDVWENGFGEKPLLCPYHGGRSHCAVPENASVRDGRLVLEATDETPTVPEDEQWQEGSDPQYSAGVVNTQDAFEQEYGYFETKARIEAGPGTNPAFWLFTIDDEVHREINVEFPGDEHGKVVDFGIVHEDGSEPTHYSHDHYLRDTTDERFHVFGVEWRPDEIALDVDGERVFTEDRIGPVANLRGEPLYVVFDFTVFEAADWIGDPADADFPLEFEVEWVRVWQHEAHA